MSHQQQHAPVLSQYDNIRHVGSAIMWSGSSYMSKPNEVSFGINANNDLVAHYYKTNSTVIHHYLKKH